MRGPRLLILLAVGVAAGRLTFDASARLAWASDFAQNWAAARLLFTRTNPYEAIGPGRAFEWSFPYLYPLPAALLAAPFAWLPLEAAEVVFMSVSSVLLVIALTRERLDNPQLWALTSPAMLGVLSQVQWTPLLMAGALLPSLGFLLAAKPTIAAALFAAYPSLRAFWTAAAFTLLSLVIWPAWPLDWVHSLSSATHMLAVVQLTGGPLVLLVLLRWRRPEARLLAALACIPHTPLLYDLLPLFLVVRRWWEGVALSMLMYVAYAGLPPLADNLDTFVQLSHLRAERHLWLLYGPLVALVLWRPNLTPIEEARRPTASPRARVVDMPSNQVAPASPGTI